MNSTEKEELNNNFGNNQKFCKNCSYGCPESQKISRQSYVELILRWGSTLPPYQRSATILRTTKFKKNVFSRNCCLWNCAWKVIFSILLKSYKGRCHHPIHFGAFHYRGSEGRGLLYSWNLFALDHRMWGHPHLPTLKLISRTHLEFCFISPLYSYPSNHYSYYSSERLMLKSNFSILKTQKMIPTGNLCKISPPHRLL